MELTLSMFMAQAGDHPALIVILLLVIGVTVVSGATDAPNAIASAVSTRCLSPGAALALAGVGFIVHYIHRDGYITCPVTGKVREG